MTLSPLRSAAHRPDAPRAAASRYAAAASRYAAPLGAPSRRAAPLAAALRFFLVASLGIVAIPGGAESLATSASSAASSASSAGSASLRGSSDSISNSSDSSRRDREVAEGEYRVVSVDAVDGRPDMVRLTLEPMAADGSAFGFRLDLPQRALGERRLSRGDTVRASQRPYGLEFARGRVGDAFFLVLADDWQRDLQTRVLAN